MGTKLISSSKIRNPAGGGGTPILDLTGCTAQQGVLLLYNYATGCPFLTKLCDRVLRFITKLCDRVSY